MMIVNLSRINKTISGNLIRFRLSRRYSQQEIADLLQIAQSTYNRYETGSLHIGADHLCCLADLYGVPVGTFFGEFGTGQNQVNHA